MFCSCGTPPSGAEIVTFRSKKITNETLELHRVAGGLIVKQSLEVTPPNRSFSLQYRQRLFGSPDKC